MPLDVRADHLKLIHDILQQYVSDRTVWAYGSRVTGKARKTSDLDIVVIGNEPLSFNTLAALRDAFSESNIPYKVDVNDWATITEEFRQEISKKYIIIQGQTYT